MSEHLSLGEQRWRAAHFMNGGDENRWVNREHAYCTHRITLHEQGITELQQRISNLALLNQLTLEYEVDV